MTTWLQDKQIKMIGDVIRLHEAFAEATYAAAPEPYEIVSQPTKLPEPRERLDEELKLVDYLERLGPDDRPVVLAVFWLGRGHSPADSYPGLLADAAANLDDFVGYMMGKTNLAEALHTGAEILGVEVFDEVSIEAGPRA